MLSCSHLRVAQAAAFSRKLTACSPLAHARPHGWARTTKRRTRSLCPPDQRPEGYRKNQQDSCPRAHPKGCAQQFRPPKRASRLGLNQLRRHFSTRSHSVQRCSRKVRHPSVLLPLSSSRGRASQPLSFISASRQATSRETFNCLGH